MSDGTWIYRYSWPASDAAPHGKQTIHEEETSDKATAEMFARLWRDAQGSMGLKQDAEAVFVPARSN